MRIFEEFNTKSKCEICKTNENKPSILIPKVGTKKGNNCEAAVFHVDCLDLWYDEEIKCIFQRFEKVKIISDEEVERLNEISKEPSVPKKQIEKILGKKICKSVDKKK
jgi:hypothetical protein